MVAIALLGSTLHSFLVRECCWFFYYSVQCTHSTVRLFSVCMLQGHKWDEMRHTRAIEPNTFSFYHPKNPIFQSQNSKITQHSVTNINLIYSFPAIASPLCPFPPLLLLIEPKLDDHSIKPSSHTSLPSPHFTKGTRTIRVSMLYRSECLTHDEDEDEEIYLHPGA